MKQILIAVAVLVFFPALATAANLEKVESEVYEKEGTVQEIAKAAKTCIASIVRNDEVRIADSSAGSGFFAKPSDTGGHSDGIGGGSLFVNIDLEGGVIVANNRVDYTAALLARNVKSTLTFLSKEGRFKIKHTNIEYLQKNTGYAKNSGYTKIYKGFGSGWKGAKKALDGISTKVAECVKNGPAEENW